MTAATATTLDKPHLAIDLNKVAANIARMAQRMQAHGVSFRPHFKTHQCAAVGELFRGHGVNAITVSSLDMAGYFADHGWQDITLAVPVNPGQLSAINALARRIRLSLLVGCDQTTRTLNDSLGVSCPLWVKVDVGYGRAGVRWDDEQGLVELVRLIEASDRLEFACLLSHSGHTYACRGRGQVSALFMRAGYACSG